MQRFLEKMSILSLSFMLVSTYAVSPAVPAMMKHFAGQGYGSQEVNFLITVTSLAIMVSLLLNPLISKFLSEQSLISLGLVLIALGGSAPLYVQDYSLMFLGRIVLGLGLGLINARAINLVSQHYEGKERVQVMGLRGSSEVLGSASLTALVGGLLSFGWSAAFAIYLLAFLILWLYWRYVPKETKEVAHDLKLDDSSSHPQATWLSALAAALIAGFVINVNTALTLKIPVIIQDSGFGSSTASSWVLSAMMLMGILAGLAFGHLLAHFQLKLLSLALFLFSLAVLLSSLAQNILILALGALVSGFFYSVVLTFVFHRISETAPKSKLNQFMTIVLVGCNLGGASSAFIPGLLAQLNPTASGAFGVYAILGLIVSACLFWKRK